jgi:hypothetical protein
MDHKIWTDVVIWVNVAGISRFWLLCNFVFNNRYEICLLQTPGSRGSSPYKLIHRVIYIYIYIYIIWNSSKAIKIIIIIINIIIITVHSGAFG